MKKFFVWTLIQNLQIELVTYLISKALPQVIFGFTTKGRFPFWLSVSLGRNKGMPEKKQSLPAL